MTEPYQITPLADSELADQGIARAKINQLVNVVNELLVAQSKTYDYLQATAAAEKIVGDGRYVTRAETTLPLDEGDWDLTVEEHVGEDVG